MTYRHRWSLYLLAAFTACVAVEARADCEPYDSRPFCFPKHYHVNPSGTLMDVPRNVELRMLYYVKPDFQVHRPHLYLKGGAAVAVDWQEPKPGILLGRPLETLSPTTEYVLEHDYALCSEVNPRPADRCEPCLGTAPARLFGFTTGATLDTTPPAPPKLWIRHVSSFTRGETPCGYVDSCVALIQAEGEEGSDIRLYRGKELLLEEQMPYQFAIGVHDARSFAGNGGIYLLQIGAAQYTGYAVDAAGNLSEPTLLDVPACHDSDEPPEAEATPAAAKLTPEADAGCSLSRSQDPARASGTWLLGLSLLALLVRRNCIKPVTRT